MSDAGGANFAAARVVLRGYDAGDRVVREEWSAGGAAYAVTGYGYDAVGRPVCAAVRMDPGQWGGQSDACAAQTSGPNGPDRVTTTAYDDAGRPLAQVSGSGTAAASTEQRSYTANGQVASVTDGNGNVTSYGYDGLDRLRATTFPDGSFEQLAYDAGSNVTSRRLRDGQTLRYGYDALGRRVVDDNPGTNVAEVDVSYGYDLAGRLLSASDGNGWFKGFEYDALGRATRQSSNVSSTSLQYDAAGRMTRQTWVDGFFVTYEYDAAGAMTAIRENGGLELARFGYDDEGRRVSLARGNGTTTSYAYDGASRLTALSQDLGGTAQDLQLTFGYNPAGQIASRTSSNDAYAWTGAVSVDRPYAVNGLNQYTAAGGTGFGYDARGNLTQSGSVTYQYNTRNQLFMAGGQLFYRNPVGEIGQTPGINYDWVNGQLATESGGPVLRRYVYGPGSDEPLVWYEGPGTGDRRWLHADERGSIVVVTNGAGLATAIDTYDEYGIPGANNQGRFQYTGQVWQPELGMYDYKARMYSPTLGRFLQTDPIGYADGMNWYNYVKSDPVNFIDPSGTDLQCNDGRYFKASELKKFGDTPPCDGVVIATSGGGGDAGKGTAFLPGSINGPVRGLGGEGGRRGGQAPQKDDEFDKVVNLLNRAQCIDDVSKGILEKTFSADGLLGPIVGGAASGMASVEANEKRWSGWDIPRGNGIQFTRGAVSRGSLWGAVVGAAYNVITGGISAYKDSSSCKR